MKHMLFVLLFSLFAVVAFAESNKEVEKLTVEFSKAMGIDHMLKATNQQTRESLESTMFDLSSNLKAQYPNLSDEKKKIIDEILNTYMNFILNSVDIDKAAHIYARVIAEGLPAEEIKAATEYYKSPEGKNLLKVVGLAAAELNKYILNQMGEATKIAQAQLIKSIGEFKGSLSATQSK